jgi:hypothetical protein
MSGDPATPETLGRLVGARLVAAGAGEILDAAEARA